MSIKGREELHRFAQTILGSFLVAAKQEGLGEEAKTFLASDRCAELVNQFLGNLTNAVASEMAQERRADPFRRLMVHPLTEVLESGGVSRGLLPNYFNFLHLVLGDDGQADHGILPRRHAVKVEPEPAGGLLPTRPTRKPAGNAPAVILIGRAESLKQMGFFGPDDGRMQENVGERSEQHGPLVAVHGEDAGAYQNIARVER